MKIRTLRQPNDSTVSLRVGHSPLRGFGLVPGVCAAALALGAGLTACSPAPRTSQEMEEPTTEPTATVEEVRAAYEGFIAGWEEEDLTAVVNAFSADGVAIDPVPPGKFEGAEGIRMWVSGAFENLDGISITSSEMQVHTEGPAAWLTARYVFEAAQLRDEGFLSMVWVKDAAGEYEATLFHASRIPEQEAAGGDS